jgi:hypothetical protein
MKLTITILLIFCCYGLVVAQDRQCDPGDTLCVAEVATARLAAAQAKIASLNQQLADKDAIIGAKDQLLGVKDQIIANLKQIDTNSQRIDTLGQDSLAIMREQHRDDKETIGDLQKSLDSCRGNQKWFFGAGSVIGGVVGYKIRGAGQIQNPFVFNPAASSFAKLDFSQFQLSSEDRVKQALKAIQK